MKYLHIEHAIFKERPNRFIAIVTIDGEDEICHVKNTGRCKELLILGARILVQRNNNTNRKTALDLISVYKGDRLINMDSQIPNRVVEEWIRGGNLFNNISLIKPEKKYGNSRFDFYIEASGQKIYMEVKGVTLEEEGVVRFPDAPTQRGVKHIEELCACIGEGYEAYIFFVIQMKDVAYFTPNERTHMAFKEALEKAEKKGVHILAYDCMVTEDEITMGEPISVRI